MHCEKKSGAQKIHSAAFLTLKGVRVERRRGYLPLAVAGKAGACARRRRQTVPTRRVLNTSRHYLRRYVVTGAVALRVSRRYYYLVVVLPYA
jgi:hypothetical protein